MTTLTVLTTNNFNMFDSNIGELYYANDYIATSTYLKVVWGPNEYDLFTGVNLTYNIDGEPTGGTVTGYKYYYYGYWVDVSGASIPATTLSNYAKSGNTTGAFQYILSGNDTMTGNAGWDVLSGYAGNDSITGNAGNDSLSGGDGNDTINGGSGSDTMIGGYGNDTFIVDNQYDRVTEISGQGTDLIKSSITYSLVDTDGAGSNGGNVEKLTLTGTNAINGTGNGLVNTLTGNSAANILKGLAGKDTLIGNGGNDKLYGGGGNDVLTGGLGVDRFVFDTARNASTNIDTIKDFVHGTDKIVLDDDFYALGITGTASGVALTASKFFVVGSGTQDTGDRIIYDQSTGKLYYDPDGSGAGAQVQFALLGTTTHPTLSASDFLVIA